MNKPLERSKVKTKNWFSERAIRLIRVNHTDKPSFMASERDFYQLLTKAQQPITEGIRADDKDKIWDDFQRFFHRLTSYMDDDDPARIAVIYRCGQEFIEFISDLLPEERGPYLARQLATLKHNYLCASIRKLYYELIENPKGQEQLSQIREKGRKYEQEFEVLWQEYPDFEETANVPVREYLMIIEGNKQKIIDEFGMVFYREYKPYLGE